MKRRAFLTLLSGAAAILPFGACSGLNSSPRKAPFARLDLRWRRKVYAKLLPLSWIPRC